jgi:N6-adenosine-specific RNA methylase IME4
MPSPALQIFISYAKTGRPLASKLVAMLETEGWKVWWDTSLAIGDDFRNEIMTELFWRDVAADDCALFLWAVDPLLDKAFELIRAWGFEYKTVGFYWVKQNSKSDSFFTGLGYWTRANPEQCLLATRGKPRRQEKDVRKLIVEPRREHSRKPEEVRERIERLVAGPYLELFARETKPEWHCWGDQAGLFDQGAVATRRQPSRLVGGTLSLPLG